MGIGFCQVDHFYGGITYMDFMVKMRKNIVDHGHELDKDLTD